MTDLYPIHWAAKMLPPLSDEVEESLTDSIREVGCKYPGTLTADGQVLDGVNRQRICAELDVEMSWNQLPEMPDEQLMMLSFTLNFARRQLGQAERRDLVAMLTARGMTLRPIGKALGVSKSQVQRDLQPLPPAPEVWYVPSTEEEAKEALRKACDDCDRYSWHIAALIWIVGAPYSGDRDHRRPSGKVGFRAIADWNLGKWLPRDRDKAAAILGAFWAAWQWAIDQGAAGPVELGGRYYRPELEYPSEQEIDVTVARHFHRPGAATITAAARFTCRGCYRHEGHSETCKRRWPNR